MKRGSSVPSLTPAQASRLSWPWALAAQHGGGIQTGAALTLTESQALGGGSLVSPVTAGLFVLSKGFSPAPSTFARLLIHLRILILIEGSLASVGTISIWGWLNLFCGGLSWSL